MTDFVNLTADNLETEHLCCIIRTKTKHPGVEAKRKWLAERLKEGHVFRKLDVKGTVFIEYAPLEKAWVPVEGENYLYLYCLWVLGEYRGKGYAKELLEYAINDAKAKGKSGICMLGAKKQKAWLSDQAYAKKYGFVSVDTTESGYELLALSFDGTYPHFGVQAKAEKMESQDLTIYYDMQCPFVCQTVEKLREYCDENQIQADFVEVDTLEKAKHLPCVFQNWAVFYKGKFQTVNLLDVKALQKLLK